MFKRIDDESEPLEGFSYISDGGDLETVELIGGNSSKSHVIITNDCGCNVDIYTVDIPKLIKALQAAYDYKGY